jgi:putative glutamine amidotransferase
MSKPRIAIPLPTSNDFEYNLQSWPAYARAVESAGGEPVKIDYSATPSEIAKIAGSCQGILLPGSPADVNPQKYGQEMDPATSPADLPRENIDELLLQDAHNLHKPILGICYGVQSLNVWRGGTLIQDLAGPLPVNHSAGKSVGVAHTATIATNSLLASVVPGGEISEQDGFLRLPVNSSHHQAVGVPGDHLRVVARCPQDGVIEAVEGGQKSDDGKEHFVLGVQWHPERSYEISEISRAIFKRFVDEAVAWTPRAIHTSIA